MIRALVTAFALALPGTAAAQSGGALAPAGTECDGYAVIAGTAGLRNAREAIVANATTYSASSFAQRTLARTPPDTAPNEWIVTAHYEQNGTFGAARMPVSHGAAGAIYADCAARYAIAMRPFDLLAQNLGVAVRRGRFGLFYAGSLTWAEPPPGASNFFRYWMGTVIRPVYASTLLTYAPIADLLFPGDLDFRGATTSLQIDYLAGATGGFATVDLGAAWLGSQGASLHLSEEITKAYAFASFPKGRSVILQAGFDRAKLPGPAGLVSAAYQQLPFTQGDGADEPAPVLYQLRVGRVEQHNIARFVDVMARYRISPSPEVSELAVGVHTADYHLSHGDEPDRAGFLVRAGYVTTPAAWAEGNGPGRLFSARVEVGADPTSGAGAILALLFNDPDQLQLYPFARNAVSYRLAVGGSF